MLMRTDPFRDLDRVAQQVLGTPVRPAAMPIDAYRKGDEFIAKALGDKCKKTFLLLNKTDRAAKHDKDRFLKDYQALGDFADVLLISAKHSQGLDGLKDRLISQLPPGEQMYPEDEYTDQSSSMIAAELIREKVMRQLGGELPYQIAVEIERYKTERGILFIDATILVERDGQKAIVIGGGGARLRQIGTEARKDMERMFDQKVMLTLWVKVKRGWSDDERALKSLGFDEQ